MKIYRYGKIKHKREENKRLNTYEDKKYPTCHAGQI
jgi:hypothetical protein